MSKEAPVFANAAKKPPHPCAICCCGLSVSGFFILTFVGTLVMAQPRYVPGIEVAHLEEKVHSCFMGAVFYLACAAIACIHLCQRGFFAKPTDTEGVPLCGGSTTQPVTTYGLASTSDS